MATVPANEVDVRLLGRVQLTTITGTSAFAGAKQRAIFARLAWTPGRTVSADELVDAVWGDHPPDTVRSSLQVHISHLRRSLESLGAPHVLQTRNRCYLLTIDESAIDLHRFDAATTAVRRLVQAGRFAEAADTATTALDLWVAAPFEGTGAAPFVEQVVPWLDARRIELVCSATDAFLGSGRPREILPRVELLVRSYPYCEPLWASAARLLYAADMQTQALERLRHLRRALHDDLGLEPGPACAELERRILIHDPALLVDDITRGLLSDVSAATTTQRDPVRRHAPPFVPRTMPRRAKLVGRDDELARLLELLGAGDDTPSIITVTGPSGIGCSALVGELARRLSERGDDVAHVTMDATVPSLLDDERWSIAAVARACGWSGDTSRADDRSWILTAVPPGAVLAITDRPTVAASATVEATMPAVAAWPGPVVIARDAPLGVPGEFITRIGALSPEATMELLVSATAAKRGRPIDPSEMTSLEQIARITDGVPAVIEQAARRLATTRANDLAAGFGVHERLATGVPFASLDRLGETAREILQIVRWRNGPFDGAEVLRTLPRSCRDTTRVAAALAELVESCLLVFEPENSLPYRMLTPIALSLRSAQDDDVRELDGLERLAIGLATMARAKASQVGTTQEPAAVEWLLSHVDSITDLATSEGVRSEAVRRSLVRSAAHALVITGRSRQATRLVTTLSGDRAVTPATLELTARTAYAADEYEAVVACYAACSARSTAPVILLSVGHLAVRSLRTICDFDRAHAVLDELSALAETADPVQRLAHRMERGMVLTMEGATAEARTVLRPIAREFSRAGLDRLAAACLVYEAWHDLLHGNVDRARALVRRADAVAVDGGHLADQAFCGIMTARTLLSEGDRAGAVSIASRAANFFRAGEERVPLARALEVRGLARHASGDRDAVDDDLEAERLRDLVGAPCAPVESMWISSVRPTLASAVD